MISTFFILIFFLRFLCVCFHVNEVIYKWTMDCFVLRSKEKRWWCNRNASFVELFRFVWKNERKCVDNGLLDGSIFLWERSIRRILIEMKILFLRSICWMVTIRQMPVTHPLFDYSDNDCECVWCLCARLWLWLYFRWLFGCALQFNWLENKWILLILIARCFPNATSRCVYNI